MKSTVRTRITVAMVVCSGIAMIVLGRAIQIQIAGDPKLEQMANRQFKSKVLFRPRRGMIVDRQGEPLAVNVETQSLAVNPSKIQNKKTLAKLLARALDVPSEKILERLRGGREFAWVKRHLSEEEIQRLKQWNLILPSGELAAGFWMVNESKRTYPHGDVARQILGSVNLDSEGIEGIELWKEEQLKGKIARASAIRDALGRPSFMDAVAARGAQDGAAVELTIDASLQFKVEQSLRQALEKTQARSGLVIVMDAISGEILALADQAKSGSRNRAVTDAYEPGSTLKPLLLARRSLKQKRTKSMSGCHSKK
jgi:cell division protein FtsI (penicillin-binding protein 3)